MSASSQTYLSSRAIFRGLVAGVLLCMLQQRSAASAPPSFQEATVRGFITDVENGQALQGANVVFRDGESVVGAAVTNADGFYQTGRLAPGEYVIQVSFVGYRTHRDTLILADGIHTYSIALSPETGELDEVTIESHRVIEGAEAGLRPISGADLQRIPSAGPDGDLASYLGTLPGVVARGDRGGQLYVRGGTPSQNLILVDGLPIHNPFHIIGGHSALPSDLVASADFYAGGFGARYMGRTSSVLDVSLRAGNAQAFGGRAGIGPFTASASVEGPIRRGATSFLVHYRRSLIEQTGPWYLNIDAPYFFEDVTAKVQTRGRNSTCSFLGLHTLDRGRLDPSRASMIRWGNTVAGFRCAAFAPDRPEVYDVRTGFTRYHNSAITEDGARRAARTWRIFSAVNAEVTMPWGETEWGFWTHADKYMVELQEPFLDLTETADLFVTAGGHAGATWRPNETLALNGTVGLWIPTTGASPTLEPRVRLTWEPGRPGWTSVTAAAGVYRQSDEAITDERDAGFGFSAWIPVHDAMPYAFHYLLGLNQRIGRGLTAHVEAYVKNQKNLPVARWTPIVRFNTSVALADGTSQGIDARLAFQRGPLFLSANYGLSTIRYRANTDDLGAWIGGQIFEYHPPHDQRHTVNLIANLDFSFVELKVRWQFGSGLPFTAAYGYDTFLELRGLRNLPTEQVGRPRMLYAQTYAHRLPTYHRLDASVASTFTIRRAFDLSIEAGAMNMYDRRNLFYMDLYTLDRVDQLPIIPYIALSVDM